MYEKILSHLEVTSEASTSMWSFYPYANIITPFADLNVYTVVVVENTRNKPC